MNSKKITISMNRNQCHKLNYLEPSSIAHSALSELLAPDEQVMRLKCNYISVSTVTLKKQTGGQ